MLRMRGASVAMEKFDYTTGERPPSTLIAVPDDVGGGIRGEKAGDVGELLRPTDAAERNILGSRSHVVLKRNPGLLCRADVLIGLDKTDQQRIDQDVVGRALPGKHF